MKETKRWIGGWAMAIVLAGTSAAQMILTAPVKAMASEPVMVVEGSAVAAAAGPESAWSQAEGAGAEDIGSQVVTQGVESAGTQAAPQGVEGAGSQEEVPGGESAGGQAVTQGVESAGSQAAPQGVEGMESQAEPGGTAADAAQGPEIAAPSAILMEASTGQVIYEKNADQQRSPASITKIMTLILIFDALESGKISMTDQVVTSAYAKSMGGSQVFLEEGETQTVETMIKCIVIASGNDASVAMAEYIAGDEKTFVDMMNQRAQGLGMANTHFEDCCGLTESKTHVTTARDIALMSRELINHYPQIHNYSTIWIDTITHVTKQGSKEFGLSNTNKLLKMPTNFEVTGLKTGSTSLAKYCLSATAEKDGVRMIASIMAAPDYKARFSDAATLLNYGYANCRLYEDREPLPLPQMAVRNGVEDSVSLRYEGTFSYLGLHGENFDQVEKTLVLTESMEAPVEEGQSAGALEYRLGGEKLGELPVVAGGNVEKARFKDYMKKVFGTWLIKDSSRLDGQTRELPDTLPETQTEPGADSGGTVQGTEAAA